MSSPIVIDYYSDVLCVWAWIAQRRLDELNAEWGEKIEVHYHYLNLFANTEQRIGQGWADRNGFAGFSNHVIESAMPYPDAVVHERIWLDVRPKSSLNAHLLLKAIELVEGREASARYSYRLRQQFFEENQDIGDLDLLLNLAKNCGFSQAAVDRAIKSGDAAAQLARDYQLAQEQRIQGSPSWVMNNGRQTLYGNVGYRLLSANIRELLDKQVTEASWC